VKSDFKGLEEDVWPVLPHMVEIEKKLKKNYQKWLKN